MAELKTMGSELRSNGEPTKRLIDIRIDRKMVNTAIERMSEELAKEMHYQFLFLRHLPEIKIIEGGKIKALKNEEIDKFIDELTKFK